MKKTIDEKLFVGRPFQFIAGIVGLTRRFAVNPFFLSFKISCNNFSLGGS